MFKDWTAEYANSVLDRLNEEIPYAESGLDLKPEEIEWYNEALAYLRREREANPGIPVRFSPVELYGD